MNQSYNRQFKPKISYNSGIYRWTRHVRFKMAEYGLAEGRLKRIIRFPKRTEEGIAPGTVAVMQPAGTKKYQEIWVMYKIENSNVKIQISKLGAQIRKPNMKIITAWRYPGKSPERNPVPKAIIDEVLNLL